MAMSDPGQVRRALPEYESAVQVIAEEAYAPYIKRIGKRPAPMDADFNAHRLKQELYVYLVKGQVVGFIVTYVKDDCQFVENIAVGKSAQGMGIGASLMAYAEEMAHENKKSIVRLYTNEKMTESRDFYLSLGFVEMERRCELGFNRIYLEKRL